jgi:pilus assembly protein CpaE
MQAGVDSMRTLLISPDQTLNAELATALAQYPEIALLRQITDYPEPDELMRLIRSRRPDFVFISASDFSRFEALAAAIDDRMAGLPVIAVGRDVNPLELIPKLMHLGIRELVTVPITQEKLRDTIAWTAAQLSKHPAPLVRLADLYAFFPAKPGVGSSTIAISTSCALAHELGVRTILLDCDLAAGVSKFLLKLGPSASIVNAMDHADSLDEDLWSQMVGNWDGLDVLHAGELDPPTSLTAASLDKVLSLARAQYDTICADLASSLDPFSVQIMREARRIFLTTTPELVPVHMAADRLRHLNELGLGDKVSLLLNRKNPMRWGLPDSEVSHLVGLPIAHQFSNDYPLVQSAILDGTPVSNHSSLGHSILDLARSLAPDAAGRQRAPVEHRKFLEFFQVPASRDHDTVWRG